MKFHTSIGCRFRSRPPSSPPPPPPRIIGGKTRFTSCLVSHQRDRSSSNEMLSRVAASSLRRFRCLSKPWLSAVSHPHPDHREELSQSQPLAGFFYNSTNENRFPESALHFVNASGQGRPLIYPSFAFLPSHRRLCLWDCCSGLLLCRWYDAASTRGDEFQYVVCNPATEQWVVLPDVPGQAGRVGTTRLGFDPAVSSHFHVFVLLLDAEGHIAGVDVYSSESGRWIHKEKGWHNDVRFADPLSPTVFLNGYLHFRTVCDQRRPHIAAVDTKGESWSIFATPCGMFRGYHDLGLIQQSHGRLHYVSLNSVYDDGFWNQLQVYALKGYANKEWILKHRVEDLNEFQGVTAWGFEWIAIDSECNSVFFVDGSDQNLRRYDINHKTTTTIGTLGDESQTPYLPYVPFYSELESLRQ